jgi:hypothetical protein
MATNNTNAYSYRNEEEAGGKFGRKAKESPFMIIGNAIKFRFLVWKITKITHDCAMTEENHDLHQFHS